MSIIVLNHEKSYAHFLQTKLTENDTTYVITTIFNIFLSHKVFNAIIALFFCFTKKLFTDGIQGDGLSYCIQRFLSGEKT